jgi:hypothetical protein
MPITLEAFRAAARRGVSPRARTLVEARELGLRTVFLSHSHSDGYIVQGLAALLSEAGWRAYIDWQDAEMPERPDGETAARIEEKIRDLDYFLFLATPNSMASRWCPWEIGYADGVKDRDRLVVIPTTDAAGQTHGSEYLQLYRRLDLAHSGRLAVWQPGDTKNGIRVESL